MMHLPFLLGTRPSGMSGIQQDHVLDLAALPHLLVAGTTGSGKSVFLNTIIVQLIGRAKFMLFDPKRVEFAPYRPLIPAYVEDEDAALALEWLVEEMERRYALLEKRGVRDIDAYNRERPIDDTMYRIVVVVDELASLMLGPEKVRVGLALTRLAQMSRAVGIHLVLATQRPTVDVVTGLLKANIPARVAFAVVTQTDSRVILDEPGAETLLGKGQLLARIPGERGLKLLQGIHTTLEDVEEAVRAHTEVHR